MKTQPTYTCYITLLDDNAELQSAGVVTIKNGHLSLSQWIMGGDHVSRRPMALIRRIALDWGFDGADRAYSGMDDRTGVQFTVRPS